MANPVIVACPADAWTKVATNVTAGNVYVLDQSVEYLSTYRMTTDPAPTARTEGIKLDPPGQPISAAAGIDVYVYAITNAGSVRVDL
jgi:hypothetical protein